MRALAGSGSHRNPKVSGVLVNRAWCRLQTVTKYPNLVGGDPGVSKDQSRCQTSWGGAPSPLASRSLFGHLKKSTKSHRALSATEADAHTFASLRSLQPRVLPFVLSPRLPLLTRPRPAQPQLLTADSAGKASFCHRSASPSPLRGHACSLNAGQRKERVSGLCQVHCLHMLILAARTSAPQGGKSSS